MTDEQIKKAMEFCNNLHLRCGDGCPYYEVPYKNGKSCSEMMIDDALDLINRQQAEIERLNKVSEICGDCHKKYVEKIAKAKSEAIKEFAERLKDIFTAIDGTFECWEVEGHIDNLVAKMVGDRDER